MVEFTVGDSVIFAGMNATILGESDDGSKIVVGYFQKGIFKQEEVSKCVVNWMLRKIEKFNSPRQMTLF